ncbi:ATP-binding protein [Micromonospora sp. DR5-3]|uniref:sensor histidine kinase n=1 Tax=unclassified Micromonospora TaxID=2617518 RepID=UPI0011DC25C9|nr:MULTISPECIES: ATP-binding protein [unclassified Micromonospora]MCW3815918.1 ATP-binding protein [Micromonospora sp. DR5-3]TYC24420.1 ATP-binding protein [Micromonospora sp. MP36]
MLLGALAYRVFVLPVALTLLAVRGGTVALASLLPVGMLLLAGNVVAFVASWRRPTADLARLRGAALVDLAVAYGVNVVASAAAPDVEVFWSYLAGAVVLTTGAYGLLGGVVAVLLSVPVQVSMAAFGAAADAGVVAGRFGWLGSAVAVTMVALVICGLSVHMAMLYGIRAGREAERARSLRSMHDTVLQTLEAIALHSAADETSPAAKLAELRGVARAQAGRLRRVLDEFGGAPDTPLAGALAELVGEFAVRGLRVELAVAAGAGSQLPGRWRDALLGVVREALSNVAKHAGVGDAVVRVDEAGDTLVVVVRDHGCGFDLAGRPGFGIRESIVARTREVGGTVSVESWPGRGTRVTLRMPA